jgi:hypothetical protein
MGKGSRWYCATFTTRLFETSRRDEGDDLRRLMHATSRYQRNLQCCGRKVSCSDVISDREKWRKADVFHHVGRDSIAAADVKVCVERSVSKIQDEDVG